MLTFVDDLGRFPRIWGYGNYQAIPYQLNTHMTYADISAKVFFKFVYLMSTKIVKRLILRDMFPLCLQRNVSNKSFPDC